MRAIPRDLSRGYTLIELMITMTIVGILTTVMIPSYAGYAVRARVTEGLVIAATAKTRVSEVVQSGQATPGGYATAFVPPAATTNFTSVAVDPVTGVITMVTTARAGAGSIVLSPYTGVNTRLPNATAPFTPPGSIVKWQCMSAGSTSIVAGIAPGTLATRFAPPECR